MVTGEFISRRANDPTFYPDEDEVGTSVTQLRILVLLLPLVERYLRERGAKAFVGSDQFIYWVQFAPTICVSPDLYVMPGIAPDASERCWKLWETGVVPSFALEVVSRATKKDYEQAPARHAELGVNELLVFDPEHRDGRNRVRWTVYRRMPKRGFVQAQRSDGDRVRSRALGCWFRAVGEGEKSILRIGTGPHGDELYPTDAERADEQTRRADEGQRVADTLKAEVARLRAQLDRPAQERPVRPRVKSRRR